MFYRKHCINIKKKFKKLILSKNLILITIVKKYSLHYILKHPAILRRIKNHFNRFLSVYNIYNILVFVTKSVGNSKEKICL